MYYVCFVLISSFVFGVFVLVYVQYGMGNFFSDVFMVLKNMKIVDCNKDGLISCEEVEKGLVLFICVYFDVIDCEYCGVVLVDDVKVYVVLL